MKKNKKAAKKAAPKMGPAKSNMSSVSSHAGVRPLADRVLLRPLSLEETGQKLASGIIIPETVDKEKSEQGIVVAVGPGKYTDEGVLMPVSVKVGEKVMFSKYGYEEIKVGGVEYFIINESNILAVLSN